MALNSYTHYKILPVSCQIQEKVMTSVIVQEQNIGYNGRKHKIVPV